MAMNDDGYDDNGDIRQMKHIHTVYGAHMHAHERDVYTYMMYIKRFMMQPKQTTWMSLCKTTKNSKKK